MNNKDTKKQPSAQALSDDDLENVGGGYVLAHRPGDSSLAGLGLNFEEQAYLNSLGISFEPMPGSKNIIKEFKDADGNSLSLDQVIKIFRDGGYKNTWSGH